MSEANVDIVRAAVDAINRGDWETPFAAARPDFEYDISRTDSPLRGVYTLDQMPQLIDEFLGIWEAVTYEPEEFIAVGEHVVVPFTTHFRGRQGIELQTRAAWVWAFRDGALARLTLYQETDEALEAARGG